MLEEAKKELPEELSKRFNLNRFFASMRDIIDDELQESVPDLIEDALENPTGSYQRVSRFQTEKLMDIDRNTLAIKEMLLGMDNRIATLSGAGGAAGGGIFDGITDTIGDIIKTWLGFKMLTGGRGKPPKVTAPSSPSTKSTPKSKKTSTKPSKPRKGANAPEIPKKIPKLGDIPEIRKLKAQIDNIKSGLADARTRASLPLKLTGLYLGYELLSGDITLEDIKSGKANDKLLNIGAMGASSYVDSYLTQSFLKSDSLKKATKLAETAAQSKKAPLLQRWQLDPTDDLYRAKGKKGWNLPVTQKLTDEVLARRAPKPNRFGAALGEMGSNLKSATKSNFIVTVGFQLASFLWQLQHLPQDLPDDKLNEAVAKLAAECIANVGIQVFAGFVADLVVMSGAATLGFLAGGPVGSIFSSAIATGTSIAIQLGSMYVMDALYGKQVREIMSSDQAIYTIKQIVSWLRELYKLNKKISDSPLGIAQDAAMMMTPGLMGIGGHNMYNRVSGWVGSAADWYNGKPADTNTQSKPAGDAYSRQRNRMKYAAGTYAVNQDKKKSPVQKRLEAMRRPAREQTPEQAEQIASEDTGTLNPMGAFSLGGMMAKMMTRNGMDPAKAGQIASLMNGDGLEGALKGAYDKIGGATGMLGGAEGLKSIMSAFGIDSSISPEMAAALGISDPDTINNAIKSSSTDPNRTTTTKTMPNAIEGMVNQLNNNMTALYDNMDNKFATTTPSNPRDSFPSFNPQYSTAAATIVALRQHGMADVFSHHQGGAATQRVDVGGEVFLV